MPFCSAHGSPFPRIHTMRVVVVAGCEVRQPLRRVQSVGEIVEDITVDCRGAEKIALAPDPGSGRPEAEVQ